MTPAAIKNKVISACAGSGKTYALIQRLLHLLENGALPGEILAITFTRKAAAEIETRLLDALEQKAREGIGWAAAARRRVLFAERPEDELNIYTFHGWFGVLLAGQHWSPQWYGPADLTEDDMPIRREAWRRWLARAQTPEIIEAQRAALAYCSPYSLENLFTRSLAGNHNAWRLHRQAHPHPPPLPSADPAALPSALREYLDSAAGAGDSKTAQKAAAAAEDYIQQPGDETLAALESAFFTAAGSMRSALQKAADKQDCAPALAAVERALNDCLNTAAERRTLLFDRSMRLLAEGYLHELEAVKAENHLMMFDDLEYQAGQAVQKHGDVNTMLYRMNRRFRHILIDEFQDTSPLQWQIIHRWLDAAHGGDTAPSVFIVGDVKQAIYRFRHGDARLLEEASGYLRSRYGAVREDNNICRRLAPPLLALVNAVFKDGRLPGFIPHEAAAANQALRGRVEWREPGGEPPPPPPRRMRDPLAAPPPQDNRRLDWARCIAARVAAIIGRWSITDGGGERRLREEDILILLPQFTHIALLRQALHEQGVACSARGGGDSFAASFACRDIIALVSALLSPYNSLSLAQALRSPLFSYSDDALAALLPPAPPPARPDRLWQTLQASGAPAAETLKRWRQWALDGALPAHDLLQKIFTDGDVLARYRAASAPATRRQVSADLTALLDFALESAGGKQPLLSQFLQALQNPPAGGGGGGAHITTVHGAKGLEAPVVVLADCSFSKRHSGGGKEGAELLAAWPPSKPAPEQLIFRPSAEKRAFAALAAEEAAMRELEYENLFYVALTRARQGLLIFSFADSEHPRINALAEAMQSLAAPEEDVWVLGESLEADAPEPPAPPPAPAPEPLPPEGGMLDPYAAAAARQGSLLHQQIALLLHGYDDEAIIAATGGDLLARAKEFIRTEELQRLLADCEQYETEAEFVCDGRLRRIDLLIRRRDEIWVIDYKSGGGNLARYDEQMESYKAAVAAVYPDKPVRAAFVTPKGFSPHAGQADGGA